MHFSVLLGFAALVAASPLAEPNNDSGKRCCDEKCYKQMEWADSHDQGNASKDCKSYQKTIVTPCPTTKTVYSPKSTVTVTTTVGQKVKAREAVDIAARTQSKCTSTVCTNDQPKYADGYCRGSDFARACSCLGIKPTTVTAVQPTITTTKCGETTTITKTITPSTTRSTTKSTTASTTACIPQTSTDTVTSIIALEPVTQTIGTSIMTITQVPKDPATTTITTTKIESLAIVYSTITVTNPIASTTTISTTVATNTQTATVTDTATTTQTVTSGQVLRRDPSAPPLTTTLAAPSTTPSAPSTTPVLPSTTPKTSSTTTLAAPSTTPSTTKGGPSTTPDACGIRTVTTTTVISVPSTISITATSSVTITDGPTSTVTLTATESTISTFTMLTAVTVNQTSTSTSSITATVTSTTTTTATVTTTTTKTVAPPPARTACSSAEENACGYSCFCNIGYNDGKVACADTDACPNSSSADNPACNSDSQCVALFGPGYRCQYDAYQVCPGGRVCGRSPGTCPANTKRSLATKELELVFEQVKNGTLITKIKN